MFKRFISYYKPYKLLFSLDMAAALLIALIGVLYPIVTREMLNELIPNKNYRLIIIYGAVLLLIYFIRMLLNYFVQYYGHVMGVRMQAQMRSDMFAHLERLPYSFYDNHETGKIMSRMTNDLMDISELAHHGPENLIISGISVIISFVYLSTINLWLTLIIFACVPFLLLITMSLRGKMRNAFKRSRQNVAVINAALESSISGIRVTKAFNNSEKEKEKFEEGNKEFVASRSEAYDAMGRFHSSTVFVTDVFNVVILIAGGLFLYNGSINFGDYSAFFLSVSLFISPIMTLINFMEQFQNGVTGFERFVEIMDETPETDAPDAIALENVKGEIEFKNVWFSYVPDQWVLKDVSFHVNPNDTVAFVGATGSGKTTILSLICRNYEFQRGEILIDGIDIRRIKTASLRKHFGQMLQDVFLFSGTIRSNILLGLEGIDDDRINEACRYVNADHFINRLDGGLDEIVRERGNNFSAGQRQLLSFARTIIHKPAVMILDEATANIDTETEVLIQDSLEKMMNIGTMLIVAHRLSTIQHADNIIVLSKGEIVEQGTHQELLSKQGRYYALYTLQFEKERMRLETQKNA